MVPAVNQGFWRRQYTHAMSNKQFVGLILAILAALGGVVRDAVVISVHMGQEEAILTQLQGEVNGMIDRERHWKPSAGEWEEFRGDILRRLDSIERHLQDDWATERYRRQLRDAR